MISGQSIEKTSQQVREQFGVEKYKADRLVRTETTYFHSMSDLMTYEELGINQYVFIATLDNRTSPMCRMHDNKRYNVSEIEVGKNYPPLHPNCRSTTRAYVSEEAEQNILRRGRNQQGENEVYQNISYKEWQKLNGVKEIDEISSNINVDKLIEDNFVMSEVVKQSIENVVNSNIETSKELTKSEKEALEYYVSGDGMYINNFLRNGNDLTDFDKKLIDELDKATNNEIESKVLYRSVDAKAIFPNITQSQYEDLQDYLLYNDDEKMIVEKSQRILNSKLKEFTDKGFVSTTTDFEIARDWGDFTGSTKPIVLEIDVSENVKGINLDFLDVEEMEQKEILLARNQKFIIGDISSRDGTIYVKAKVKNK